MENTAITLEFGSVVLDAGLFDTRIGQKLLQHLPVTVKLMQWGEEFYGGIGVDLGEENPVENIPPGGIAYTRNGNYLCFFFGQKPAWAVEHVGQIADDQWPRLRELRDCRSVRITVSAGGR
jgi:hypothetical protein